LRRRLADLPFRLDPDQRRVGFKLASGQMLLSVEGPEEMHVEVVPGRLVPGRLLGWESI
jgi:hypothetical protein